MSSGALRRRSLALLTLLAAAGCRAPATAPAPESAAEATAAAMDPVVVLEGAAESLDVSLRARAIYLMIRYSPDPGGGEAGPRGLYDPSPYVQRAAIEALEARLDEPEARELLAATARRAELDPYTRGAAGVALALRGDRSTLPSLQDAYKSAESFWEAAPLALAASAMGDADGQRMVDAALRRGEFPLELGFFWDCGRVGDGSLVPALIVASDQVEEELTLAIAAALLELGASRGEAMFRQALSSSDVERAMEAVDYLRRLDDDQVDALLRRARSGGPDALQQYAKLSLLARGDGNLEMIWRAMESSDRESRQLAVQALGQYGQWRQDSGLSSRDDRKIHKALLAALQDPEAAVVMEAIQALARIGGPADQTALAPLLQADLTAVQVEAAGALLVL